MRLVVRLLSMLPNMETHQQHFSTLLGKKISECTVRNYKKKLTNQLQRTKQPVSSLPSNKRGRPPNLGEELDNKVNPARWRHHKQAHCHRYWNCHCETLQAIPTDRSWWTFTADQILGKITDVTHAPHSKKGYQGCKIYTSKPRTLSLSKL